MNSKTDKKRTRGKPIIYSTGDIDKLEALLFIAEESFEYIAPCPVCEKRVFDIDELPGIPIRVRIKCPHCRKVVGIPIYAAPM
jgi:hypothetical protein